MIDDCPEELVGFAQRIADAVGGVQLRYFRKAVSVDYKSDSSPVTQADREAEQAARELIMKHYPEHGILGEEFPAHQQDADYLWVIDPIDGTRLFMTGMPTFALLLGLAYKGEFILGVIDHAALGDRWVGANGHGTRFNGETVHARSCQQLNAAVLCRPGYEWHTEGHDASIDAVDQHVHWSRWGIAPYDYGLVASGHLDLVINMGPRVHDYAALEPVVRNAGGCVVDWYGERVRIGSPEHIIVAGDEALVTQTLPLLATLDPR